jgi:hypothetical protein
MIRYPDDITGTCALNDFDVAECYRAFTAGFTIAYTNVQFGSLSHIHALE